ncbi:hypothetical protein AGMMS49949_03900 [Alphaproteobacteria bacterium]|nr:hypothetical protein AGMMS49949_03900 [Alphaproteobacteria bacterium]GHS96076.1 hypothetical protein AGMMS50296_1850 [Alphaproteobacteria bacterium]
MSAAPTPSESSESGNSFEKEVQWQSFQKHYLKKAAKGSKISIDKHFLDLLKQANSGPKLVRLGLLSSVFSETLSPSERDTLLLLSFNAAKNSYSSHNNPLPFQENLVRYMVGKFLGKGSVLRYKKDAPSQVSSPWKGEVFLDDLCEKLDRQSSGSFYKRQVACMLKSVEFRKAFQGNLSTPCTQHCAKSFDTALGSEFGLLWLDGYIKEKNVAKKQLWEEKLLSLSDDALILAGQRALVVQEKGAIPKLIAAYTLASTRKNDLKNRLKLIIQYLIQTKKAPVFKALLVQYGR